MLLFTMSATPGVTPPSGSLYGYAITYADAIGALQQWLESLGPAGVVALGMMSNLTPLPFQVNQALTNLPGYHPGQPYTLPSVLSAAQQEQIAQILGISDELQHFHEELAILITQNDGTVDQQPAPEHFTAGLPQEHRALRLIAQAGGTDFSGGPPVEQLTLMFQHSLLVARDSHIAPGMMPDSDSLTALGTPLPATLNEEMAAAISSLGLMVSLEVGLAYSEASDMLRSGGPFLRWLSQLQLTGNDRVFQSSVPQLSCTYIKSSAGRNRGELQLVGFAAHAVARALVSSFFMRHGADHPVSPNGQNEHRQALHHWGFRSLVSRDTNVWSLHQQETEVNQQLVSWALRVRALVLEYSRQSHGLGFLFFAAAAEHAAIAAAAEAAAERAARAAGAAGSSFRTAGAAGSSFRMPRPSRPSDGGSARHPNQVSGLARRGGPDGGFNPPRVLRRLAPGAAVPDPAAAPAEEEEIQDVGEEGGVGE